MTMKTETQRINTHGFIMPNGKHAGELITRVPVSYLKWMVNIRHSSAIEAEAELNRRGTVTPDLEVSGHAIDRASLYCRGIWHKDAEEKEGLHAWLVQVFFLNTTLRTDVKPNSLLSWSPFWVTYDITLGLRAGPVEVGWRHLCTHPIQTYVTYYGVSVPVLEGSFDELYLRFEGGW